MEMYFVDGDLGGTRKKSLPSALELNRPFRLLVGIQL